MDNCSQYEYLAQKTPKSQVTEHFSAIHEFHLIFLSDHTYTQKEILDYKYKFLSKNDNE